MPSIDPKAVSALIDRARRDVDSGVLPAAQLALALNGEVVAAESFGEATNDTRFHMFSSVKPSVALTALQLAAQGRFDVTAPVADVLPGFGANGKEAITVSQVLLHLGGFPYAHLGRTEITDRPARLEAYARWELAWEPGSQFEYHPLAAHWVVADVIAEVTGKPHTDAIFETIMAPVGRPRWLGIPRDEQSDIADLVTVGNPPSQAELAALGIEELPDMNITDESLTTFNHAWMRAAGVPGGGGIARATDMALWYQAVLHNTDGFLHPEVRNDAMAVRHNLPDWFGVGANRSHVFVLAGEGRDASMRGHGHGASPEAFGHSGIKGQIAWADPASGLSFAFLTNGMHRNDLAAGRRSLSLSSKAHACLT